MWYWLQKLVYLKHASLMGLVDSNRPLFVPEVRELAVFSSNLRPCFLATAVCVFATKGRLQATLQSTQPDLLQPR